MTVAATPPDGRRCRILPRKYAAGLPGDDDDATPTAYAGEVSKVWAAIGRWWGSPVRFAVTAVVLTAVIVAGSYGEAHPTNPADKVQNGHTVPVTPNAAFLLVAAAGLVLIWRRRYPLAVLTISTAAVVAYSLLGYVNGAALLLPTVALYAVASTLSLRRAVITALVTLAVLMGVTAIGNPFGPTGGGFILIPGLIAAALFAGIAAANRRAYVESVKARAEADTRRRVDEERLRIARELHDVVAHTMATINVQAGVAAHVVADRPEAAAEALRVIKNASKEGLRELRAILDVLRQADEAEPTQPAPGLGQVDGLVAGANQAGLATSLTVTGQPRPLPAEVDLAAYRIVQESLTNAIRHAGPATATVWLGYSDAELRIDVADNGLGAPAGISEGTGHGLIGMRERASSVGGAVEAGPRPEGGFLVAAWLPIRQPVPPAAADTAETSAPQPAPAQTSAAEQGAQQ
jgi:signal transduction histidine kinase